MASRSHTSGAGQLAAAAMGSGISAVLARNDQLSADNRFAVYVAPAGRGLHLVKNVCNDQAYEVGAAAGLTFTPGQSVVLASANGQPGEVIIGLAPPGSQGASALPTSISFRPAGVALHPRAAPCPSAITGKHYVGILADGGAWAAFAYADGTVGAQIGTSIPSFMDDPGQLRLVPAVLPTRWLVGANGGQIVTWRLDSSDTVAADVDPDAPPSPVIVAGERVVFYRSWLDGSDVHLQVYAIPPGQSTPVDLSAAAVGPPLVLSGADAPISGAWGRLPDGRFVVIAVVASRGAVLLTLQGGTWTVTSNTTGSASLGVTREAGVTCSPRLRFAVRSLLIGTAAQPAIDLVPEAWGITTNGSPSASPDGGTQLSLYPFLLGSEEEGIARYLFRCAPQLATFGAGCPITRISVQVGLHGACPLAMIALD